MSDKEFDKQFRGKFEDFEITPSPMAWEGINKSLSGTQRKPFLTFEVAAASIAAVVAFGLWLAPQKEPIRLYGKVKVEEAPTPARIDERLTTESSLDYSEQTDEVFTYKYSSDVKASKFSKRQNNQESNESHTIQESKPEIVQEGQSTQVAPVEESSYQQIESQAFASGQARQHFQESLNEENTDSTTEKSRHRIKSFGDLVNFVVARVDKRRNKIIEFSKDDEGEEISGLNLGVLQYKTRAN